jgi:NADH-quinone oxidoreductase subunit G
VAFTAFLDPALAAHAEVLLPIALIPENEGSYLNFEGLEQRLAAAVPPPGEARPAWRILRALGEALALPGFDFLDLAALQERMQAALAAARPAPAATFAPARPRLVEAALQRAATVPIYRSDAVVRRAEPLQATPLAQPPFVALHPSDALRLGLGGRSRARIRIGDASLPLPLRIDPAVAEGVAWIPLSPDTATFAWDAAVELEEVADDE